MRDELLAAVRSGESVAGACRRLGLPRQTVYSWRRRHQDFEQALTEALVAGSRRVVKLPDPDGWLPDREELLRRLDAQSRAGSTRATEVLLREIRTSEEGNGGDQNPLAQVIGLARKTR